MEFKLHTNVISDEYLDVIGKDVDIEDVMDYAYDQTNEILDEDEEIKKIIDQINELKDELATKATKKLNDKINEKFNAKFEETFYIVEY
jgi:hypothetical protein